MRLIPTFGEVLPLLIVTFAAAHTLRSTLCTLAHGRALTTWFSQDDIQLMARGLGAPVTEAQGKSAVRISGSRAVVAPTTVEVICQTLG